MKQISLRSGVFRRWSFFEPQEFERIADEILASCNFSLSSPGRIDIDAVLHRMYGLTPSYRRMGRGVLGCTFFSPEGPEEVQVAEFLAELDKGLTNEHRRRSTIAHEIGHLALHSEPLCELAKARKDPDYESEWLRSQQEFPFALVFRDWPIVENPRSRSTTTAGAWEKMAEFQANRIMVSLLTPSKNVIQLVRGMYAEKDRGWGLRLTDKERRVAEQEISLVFEVSKELARHRLKEIYPALQQREDFFL